MRAHRLAVKAMLLAFVLLSYSASSAEDFYRAEGGPSIFVTSVTSNVETGKVGSVFVEIENRGEVTGLEEKRSPETEDDEMLALLEGEMEMDGAEAVGIEGKLSSRDERLEVLSRSQLAGSLSAGERLEVPMEFSVRAEESASAGTYPMVLEISYERVEDVQVQGNPLYPEIYFQRAPAKETISVEVPVMTGARLGVAEEARAGLLVQPPLNTTGEELVLGDIEPGKRAPVRFPLVVDREADPGEYPLVCQIKYRSGEGGADRREDLASLVEVKAPTGLRTILIVPTVAILLTLLYLGGAGKRLRLPKVRRRKRW